MLTRLERLERVVAVARTMRHLQKRWYGPDRGDMTVREAKRGERDFDIALHELDGAEETAKLPGLD